jgi:hypothetical protein
VQTSPPVSPETETLDRPADVDIGPGEEICHLVDMDDPDTALCGKDVTGYPWNPPWPYCVVCVDLAQAQGWDMSFLTGWL